VNNKCFIFKSFLLTKLYINLTGGKNITQGPYNVIELIRRFSDLDYTEKSLKAELISVVYNYRKYGFHVDEYFLYDVKALSHIGKSRFITEETRWRYYERFNEEKNLEVFDNKEKTYEVFKEYYGRECIAINSSNDENKYNDFVNKYDQIILKPRNSSGGKGVRLLQKDSEKFDALLIEYKNGFVMEPVLKNAPEIAEFHSNSLNTVRIVTVRLNDRVEIGFAFARFGRGDKCVDNFASNGIMCEIDTKTGIIYAAIDKRGNRYIVHPDSEKVLLGYKMPEWEKLVALVIKLAHIIPSNRYTGWDMVYTPNGWLVVEVNARGQFVGQMPAKEGFKQKFDEYISQI